MKARLAFIRGASIICLASATLLACEARNPSPVLEKVEPEPGPEIEESALQEIQPTTYGLELVDYDEGIIAQDSGPRDEITGLTPPGFSLRCNASAKVLEVFAPARQLGEQAAAGPAQLVVSELEFPGTAEVAGGGQSIQLTLPLTPDLLAAIATTVNARLVMGDAYARSNNDTNGTFPGFAGQCSLKSGVRLPPL